MIEADGALKTVEDAQEEAGCSEAVASDAPEGNTDSHTAADEIITVESSTSSETRTSLDSLSSSSSTSFDMDDVPLNKVYSNLNESLSPSPSTKNSKKLDYDTFVLMYPCVEERLIDMQQRRIDVCKNLPADQEVRCSVCLHFVFYSSLQHVLIEPELPQRKGYNIVLPKGL